MTTHSFLFCKREKRIWHCKLTGLPRNRRSLERPEIFLQILIPSGFYGGADAMVLSPFRGVYWSSLRNGNEWKSENRKTAELMFTTQVIVVDFKYKMLWCMPEISAVNMPSAESKKFHASFMFLFPSPPTSSIPASHNLFALRIFRSFLSFLIHSPTWHVMIA